MSDQWKLVPVEPTEEMLAVACPAYSSNIQASNTANREKYQRMLAAAPAQGADGESLRPVAIEAPRPSVFRSFETMCWPAPCEALGEIGHRLTYDHSDKSDRLVAASVISAYQHLMSMPAKRRDAIVSELRKGPGVIAAITPMEKT